MIGLVLMLALVGLLLYLLETYVPMDPAIKTVIRVVVVVCVMLWLMQLFGIVDWPVPSLKR